jgi:hypothetical protein
MRHILQNSKRLVSICLITLLLVNSILLSFPALASADDNLVPSSSTISCSSVGKETEEHPKTFVENVTQNEDVVAVGSIAAVSSAAASLGSLTVATVTSAAPGILGNMFQSTKKLITTLLVTLLLVTSTLTISPAQARADGGTTIIDCSKSFQPKCGNREGMAFAAGVSVGAAIGSGSVPGLSAAGITSGVTAVVDAVVVTAAPLAAVAVPAVAPVVVPVAATAAVGYGVYHLWKGHDGSQAQPLK